MTFWPGRRTKTQLGPGDLSLLGRYIYIYTYIMKKLHTIYRFRRLYTQKSSSLGRCVFVCLITSWESRVELDRRSILLTQQQLLFRGRLRRRRRSWVFINIPVRGNVGSLLRQGRSLRELQPEQRRPWSQRVSRRSNVYSEALENDDILLPI